MAETYKPNSKYPETAVRRLLNTEEVKIYSDNMLAFELQALNITPEYMLNEIKDTIKDSKKDKQHNVRMRGIETLLELAGLRNRVKIVQKESYTQDLGNIKDTITKIQEERQETNQKKDKNA